MKHISIKAAIIAAGILSVMACSELDKDYNVEQKVYFPVADRGVDTVYTMFSQTELNVQLALADDSKDTVANEIAKLDDMLENTSNGYHRAFIYVNKLPAGSTVLTPQGNISIIVKPDVQALNTIAKAAGSEIDFSQYDGSDLIAIDENGGIYFIQEIFEEDILGCMNGLIMWMNRCAYAADHNADESVSNGYPDATKLFSAFHGGYNINFSVNNVVVRHQACCDPDRLSGSGTINVVYSVLPLHALDKDNGSGDYYYVQGDVALNSQNMYRGNSEFVHGGVHNRYCGFFATEMGIESYIADKNGNAVGSFISGGMPTPGTTVGSTSYTHGVTWNLGASFTGGVTAGKKTLTGTINGGVSVTNSQTRNISDLDIKQNISNNIVKYNYVYNNGPEYKPIHLTNPTAVQTNTSQFHFEYIVYLKDVKDYSADTYNFVFKVTKLEYDCVTFATTAADLEHKRINKGGYSSWSIVNGSEMVAVPTNRIPTGELQIKHDATDYGKYIYKVVAHDNATKKDYTYDNSSYSKGETFKQYLPVGTYSLTLEIGDTQSGARTTVKAENVKINTGEVTAKNTGADFNK